MTMARLSTWEGDLAAYLAEARRSVRGGQKHACALFALGGAKAQTGVDVAAKYRGKYKATAARLEAAFDDEFPTVETALAQRGDLAFCDDSVGIVIGGDALFVGDGEDGKPTLIRVPRAKWSKAWAVGRG